MTSQATLSIIIVNWNTKELLDACLRTLQRCTRDLSCSICVIDNASQDGSVEMIRQHHPRVMGVANTHNDGFAKACNIALKVAPASDYVLFLNPDTVVLEGSIQGLVEYLKKHPEAGAATCALLNANGHFQEAQGNRFPSLRTALNQYLFLNRLLPQNLFPGIYWARRPHRIQKVDWISGAAMMVRRSAMPEGPFFDESYFMYAEDMEASLALRKRGWQLAYLPHLEMIHYVKKSTRQRDSTSEWSPISSQMLYLKRHTSTERYKWIRLLISAGFSLRYFIYTLLTRISSEPAYNEKARNHRQYLTRLRLSRLS